MIHYINKNEISFFTFIEGSIWVTDIFYDTEEGIRVLFRYNNDYRYFPNYENMTVEDLYKLTDFKGVLTSPSPESSKDTNTNEKVLETPQKPKNKGGRPPKK